MQAGWGCEKVQESSGDDKTFEHHAVRIVCNGTHSYKMQGNSSIFLESGSFYRNAAPFEVEKSRQLTKSVKSLQVGIIQFRIF